VIGISPRHREQAKLFHAVPRTFLVSHI
jgi:hypothetical protein